MKTNISVSITLILCLHKPSNRRIYENKRLNDKTKTAFWELERDWDGNEKKLGISSSQIKFRISIVSILLGLSIINSIKKIDIIANSIFNIKSKK